MESYAVQFIYSDIGKTVDFDAATGVNVTTNVFTSVAHNLVDGTKGQLTTDGTLPTGLSAATDYFIVNATTDTYQLSLSLGGAAVDVTDVGGAVKEITQIICTAEDANTTLNNKYFILQDLDGSVAVWYNVDAAGVEPAHGADRSLEVALTAADVIGVVGTATYDVIIADSKFAASADDLGGTIKVVSADYGVQVAAEDGDSGFTTSEDTAGVDSDLDGKYFILQDDEGSVGVWLNLSGTATEPTHGADRSLEVTSISVGDAIGTVGTALYTDLIADDKFAASADDTAGTIAVESSTYGVKAAAEDGDSGFTTSEDTAGTTSTNTFTPTAISGASVKIQKSCDGVNFIDVASAVNITADGTHMVEEDVVAYSYIRLVYVISAGQAFVKAVINGWNRS